jgi:cytochrome c biogenesis protein CcdA
MVSNYPVQFDVDFPSRPLDRLSTAFRLLIAIPILIVLGMLTGETLRDNDTTNTIVIGGAAVFLPLVLMLVFRQKYPRWWFDWNLNLLRFSNRVTVYLALLDDRYPSTDEEQAVHLDFAYPDARQLNRWLPLVKWLLAIPHYVVLFFLGLGVVIAVIAAWFAILLTGAYPRRLFGFVVGVLRWSNRVNGYAFTLVTDQYPPFRLS